MDFSFLLIGHRASGKSTLGRLLARHLACRFHDIDELIERSTGQSAARLVSADEKRFRAMEKEMLKSLLSEAGRSVIAAGGGMLEVPGGVCAIWIDRDGWEETALSERERLRPESSPGAEIEWMKRTRESAYSAGAHLRLRIARGIGVEETARLLCGMAGLADAAAGSPVMRKSWMLAHSPEQLDRCIADCRLFGLAGIEIRSDIFDSTPETDVPVLASLRTPDGGFFLRGSAAAAFDCDARYAATVPLASLEPRPLIVSAHVGDVDQEYFDAMLMAGDVLAERFPEWKPHIIYKFAPVVKSWVELRFAHEVCRVYRKKGGKVSLIPRGKRWNWMRAFRVREWNELNYVSPGAVDKAGLPPSLAYFVPQAAGPDPAAICGLIGDPVDDSIGDVWHRRRSIEMDGGKLAYLKIPVPPDELEHALYFLLKLNLHGLSVTSPHKAVVINSIFVTSKSGLQSGNTLTLRDGGWSLTDSDRRGMEAVLDELADRGISPGPTAVYGRGAVSVPVIETLLERGWRPVRQTGAREGWGELEKESFVLIVNAGGPGTDAHDKPPRTRAWLDIHYHGVERLPADVEVYRNGIGFFVAQAEDQRREWGFGNYQ